MKSEEEIPFSSGESNQQVVRVGDTVRRGLTRNSDLVHKVMKKLTSEGFKYSPKYLGIDEKGREIISYIPGTQMNHGEITISLARQAMTVLKQFHDILSNDDFSGEEETICHTDYAPWNLIVMDNKLVGVLDFDDITQGSRLDDITYACWNFLKIGEKGTEDKFVYSNLPKLIEAYGEVDTEDLVDSLLSEQKRILSKREARVLTSTNQQERKDRERICIEIKEQIEWVNNSRDMIDKCLNSN